MPLANYNELLTEFEAYLERSDMAARFPTFVRLVESDVQKKLDAEPSMIARATVTATGRYTALPTDFGQMISVDMGVNRMTSATSVDFAGYRDISGIPSVYTIIGTDLAIAPSSTTGTISLVYKRNIPALIAAAPANVNWLITRSPEIYLYGTLLHGSIFSFDDNRVPLWQAAFADALETLRIDGEHRRWGAAPIAPRIGRT